MPLVLSDVSSLDFDRSDSGCIYPDGPEILADSTLRPSCVDSHNSTILRDGILPV